MKKMQMNKELSFTNRTYSSKEEAISTVCRAACELGFVTEEFEKDLLAREAEFPTGLQTAIPLAMPHVGTNCNTSFMSLTTLAEPIEFGYMDGTEGTLPVEILFVFGIVDPSEQMQVLRKLTEMFRDPKALENIRAAADDDAGCEALAAYLGDLIEVK